MPVYGLLGPFRESLPIITRKVGLGVRCSRTEIPPGQSASLQITYSTAGQSGQEKAFVAIRSNDPLEPLKRLVISIRVVRLEKAPKLVCRPSTCDLGVIAVGERRVAAIAITNPKAASEPLVVNQVYSTDLCSVLGARPRKVDPGSTQKLQVAVRARRTGLLQERVDISTNDPRAPVFSIPIVGYVTKQALRHMKEEALGGLIIQAVGKPVRVPGSAEGFITRVRVSNRTSTRLKVHFRSGPTSPVRAHPAMVDLGPRQSSVVRFELMQEWTGEYIGVPVQVEYPLLRPLRESKEGM